MVAKADILTSQGNEDRQESKKDKMCWPEMRKARPALDLASLWI